MTTSQQAREYYALCDAARALGIPTSLDDPRSPQTVAGLRAAVDAATGQADDESLADIPSLSVPWSK